MEFLYRYLNRNKDLVNQSLFKYISKFEDIPIRWEAANSHLNSTKLYDLIPEDDPHHESNFYFY